MSDAPFRRTAIVCAMAMELSPMRRAFSLRKGRIGQLTAYSGSHAGVPLVAIVTGMGTARAKAGVEQLIAAAPVDRVLVVGITGAVGDAPIGTLVHPELVVDGASGTSYRPDPFDSETAHGVMWTTDELVTEPGAIAELAAREVVALDMETAAIAAVCDRARIRWSVIRAVSDRSGEEAIDAELLEAGLPDGSFNAGAAARYLIRHPDRIGAVARTARDASRAARRAGAACALALTT